MKHHSIQPTSKVLQVMRTNKPDFYLIELVRSGGTLTPVVRVIGRPIGPQACIDTRSGIVCAFQIAGPHGLPVVDLSSITVPESFFIATVALAITERVLEGGSVSVLVRPGEPLKRLKRMLPKSLTSSNWNSERNCVELHLRPCGGDS